MLSTYGDSFFDGPGMAGAKAPLIGGGVATATLIAVKKFLPSQAKWAGAIGAIAGSVAAYLLKNKLGPEGMGAAIAAALIVGGPRQLNDLMGGTLMGDDFGAYVAEGLTGFGEDEYAGLGADAAGVQIMDSGSGSAEMGAYVAEGMGAPAQGVELMNAFGATGMG